MIIESVGKLSRNRESASANPQNSNDCALRATPQRIAKKNESPGSSLGDGASSYAMWILDACHSCPLPAPRGEGAHRVCPAFMHCIALGVGLAVLSVADEILDHARVGKRRGIAEIAVLVFGDLAQD